MCAPLLQPFGPDIWLSDGSDVEVAGFRYPTRMVVIRLSGGRLFIWSPVSLSKTLRRQLQDLGEVQYLVAPNSLHQVVMAHGLPVESDGQAFIARAFRWLTR
jgi:hypothetical protein